VPKKILLNLLISLCLFPYVGHGETLEEAILSFDSNIIVNRDNSVNVTEKIIYTTGPGLDRHGIYRDIYPYSSTGRKMSITNVEVPGQNFEILSSGKNVRIKIGDPKVTFKGEKTYIIKYKATKSVGQFKDFDEIYWNVTGNEWNIPILSARASVVLPNSAKPVQSACYYGPKGSTNTCNNFQAKNLGVAEGLTVAVGFPKGFVNPYTFSDRLADFFPWILAAFLPLLTLIFSLRYWYKHGRDPKGTGVIVAQYDVPDSLTPMEAAGIVNEKITGANISAEIIYLATKGYLKINQLETKTLGIFKNTDYELVRLKEGTDLPNEFDRKLMQSLFDGNDSVKLSDLKNVFYKDAKEIIQDAAKNLLEKGYYKNLGRMKNAGGRAVVIIFLAVWLSVFLAGIFGGVVAIGIILSAIIYGIVSHFFPAKTEKGVATKEYLLGLKEYLQIAEKDRINFHNAPEKKPEIFEKLLPFAMVFGVEKAWAKEFEGIYLTPPSWYSGSPGHAFNTIYFADSMSNFNSFAASSMTSSPSSRGSGGGGFSGGGGGGGGGGGW